MWRHKWSPPPSVSHCKVSDPGDNFTILVKTKWVYLIQISLSLKKYTSGHLPLQSFHWKFQSSGHLTILHFNNLTMWRHKCIPASVSHCKFSNPVNILKTLLNTILKTIGINMSKFKLRLSSRFPRVF